MSDDAQVTNTGPGTGEQPITPTTPSEFVASDDALIRFKEGNEEKTMSWKDLNTQRMLHSDYTRKRQADAEARRQFDAEREAFMKERDALIQAQRSFSEMVTDDQKLMGLYMANQARRQNQQQQQQQQLTPEHFAQFQEQMRSNVVSQMQKELQQFRAEQDAIRFESDLDNYTRGVLRDYPLLSAVDGIEEAIYTKVAALKPGSLAEAKEQIKLAVEARQNSLVKALEEKQKRDEVEKQKATRGIEPKGGHVQLPEGKKYNSLDDKNLSKDMTAFFEEYFKNNPA